MSMILRSQLHELSLKQCLQFEDGVPLICCRGKTLGSLWHSGRTLKKHCFLRKVQEVTCFDSIEVMFEYLGGDSDVNNIDAHSWQAFCSQL
jgi:hypothetical protein